MTRRRRSASLALGLAASLGGALAARAAPARYELDPEHLTIGFLVEHIGYAKALGKFLTASGSYTFDPETGELGDLRVTVATASVDTDHEARDRHLRSADFLATERHPEMTFTATSARRTGERTFEIAGELTLLGVRRPLVLEAVWNKSAPYPIPPRTEVMGVSARGRLERSAFGMNYGVADGLVGDEVEILIEIEARRSEQGPPAATNTPDESSAFTEFVLDLRAEAEQRGISAATLDAVIPGITLHRRAVAADRAQSEFVDTYERYLQRVSPRRVERGRTLMRSEGAMITAVAAGYGVQPRFIVAILGLESDYGTFPISEPLFDVLATLAFDARRGTQFRNELFAALELVDRGFASPADLKSSWAGALGAPQFMPSNVLRLGVDHDGDGRIDLARVGPDVVASVANYLRRAGWRADQTWGREVLLPPGGEETLAAPQSAGLTPDAGCQRYQTLGAWRGLRDWESSGVRLLDGASLPARNLPAALVVGDPGDDRGYLVYRNFCSIMQYNPAFKYALAVGLLADAIATESTPLATQARAESAAR